MSKLSPDHPLAQKLIRQGKLKPADFTRSNKYGAVRTPDSTGRVHPSKLQARKTDELRAGAVAVIPEVSIPLSDRPRDRIVVDALVIEEMLDPGRFIGRFVEIKGRDLSTGIQKRRRFEDVYGVAIEVVRK